LDDESIYALLLQQYGEGLHHVLFDVADYDEARTRLEEDHPEITYGRWCGHPYSYFDTRATLGCLAEIWREPTLGTVLPPPDATFP